MFMIAFYCQLLRMGRYTVYFLCLSLGACAQMRQVCTLPVLLEENSGMVAEPDGCLWVETDGGNPACIYKIDSTGSILRTVCITNSPNKDWEDMTVDRAGGFVYIGDFGNNRNNRQDLRILRVPHPDRLAADTVQAAIIEFNYPQQQDFPPDESGLHYDAEAFFYYNESLYIFTKCRTVPYSGITRLYQVPCTAGKHEAVLLDSFDTRQASWYQSITGAAISPSGSRVALLSGGKVWIFSQFVGNNFFGGKVQTISMGWFTQKEAIDFVNDDELWLSDEQSFLGKARLYRLRLRQVAKEETGSERYFRRVRISPMPIRSTFELDFRLLQSATVAVHLYDEDKNFLQTLQTVDLSAGEHSFSFDAEALALERYFSYYIVLEAGGKREWHPVVVR